MIWSIFKGNQMPTYVELMAQIDALQKQAGRIRAEFLIPEN